MLSFLLRSMGLILFAAAFISLIADGIHSLAANEILLTPLGQAWFQYHRESLNLAQALVQRHLHPAVWDPVIQTVLLWPAFAVAGGLGLVLMLLGSRRRARPATA